MTSEMENILKGRVEAKTTDLKQIAVTTFNLTPDASGVAPLEKQSAFASKVEEKPSTPVISSDEVISIHPATQSGAPVIPSDEVISIHPATQSSTPVLDNQAQPTSENANQINSNENLESIDYNKPNQEEELPVKVESTEELDSINIDPVNSILNQLNTLEGSQDTVSETKEVKPMSMPTMDSVINAQEPHDQDKRLFVGGDLPTMESSEIPVLDSTENVDLQHSTSSESTLQSGSSSFTPFEIPPVEWPDLSKPDTEAQLQPTAENPSGVAVSAEGTDSSALETTAVQAENQISSDSETVKTPEVPLIDPTISEFSLQPQSQVDSSLDSAILPEPEKSLAKNTTSSTFIPAMDEEEQRIPSLEETSETKPTEAKSIFENEELAALIDPLIAEFKGKLLDVLNEFINSKSETQNNSFTVNQEINPGAINPEIDFNKDNSQNNIPSTLEQNSVVPTGDIIEKADEIAQTVDNEELHGKFV